MRIDHTLLRKDMFSVENRIRVLKRTIRSIPTPSSAQMRELRTLKRDATLLYAIAAHARKRLHLRRCTRSHAHLGLPPLQALSLEDQARFIAPAHGRYLVVEHSHAS